MNICVQGQNGKFYDVIIGDEPFCPCTGFKLKKRCNHIDIATDVHSGGGKQYRFDILSSLHKEIRRCDVTLGTLWARAYGKISGNYQVAKYCRNILFEETRNLDLLLKMKKFTDKFGESKGDHLSEENKEEFAQGLKEQFNLMVRSKKKWELSYMKDHFQYWTEGFENYYKNRHVWGLKRMYDVMAQFKTPAEAYELLFWVQENKTFEPQFWVEIKERATRDQNKLLLWYLNQKPDHYYGRMVSLELAINYWSEEANEYWPDKEVEVNYIPRLEDYSYDCHNYLGKQRLIKNWDSVVKGEPASGSRIDMRWSGMLLGIYHRFETFKQMGSMHQADGTDWPWDAVKLDKEFLPRVFDQDSYYYSSFYQKLRSEGYQVPIWKIDHP